MGTGKLLTLVCGLLLVSFVSAGAETLELLSLSTKKNPAWGEYPAISADSQWVTFSSFDLLLSNDKNNAGDIYIRNLGTGRMELVSVGNDESGANNFSQNSVLSADGRFVVFDSFATNLVQGDTNNQSDVFIRDRLLGTTEIVSIATDGTQGNHSSFWSEASVSADGRYVAFQTTSRLSDDDSLDSIDIYLRDRQAQTTTRIGGGTYPSLSSNGQFIAYRSYNSLVLRNMQTGTVEVIAKFIWDYSRSNNSYAYIPSISGDGRYVVYEGWSAAGAPLSTEVFIYDRQTRSTRQITHAYDGTPLVTASGLYSTTLKPKISADGRFILFFSSAADLVQGIDGNQLYRYDLVDQSTKRVPIDNLWATVLFPIFNLSGDGSVIIFHDTIQNYFPKYATNAFGAFALHVGCPPVDKLPEEDVAGLKITAEPAILWPPNSKLTDVKIVVDAPGAIIVKISVLDEYGTFTQTTHGTEVTLPLEAWRNSSDQNGRTYTITAVSSNSTGQTKTATTTVSVPHDQR